MARVPSKSTLSIAFVFGLACAAPTVHIAHAQGMRDPVDPAIVRDLSDPANARNLDDDDNGRGLSEFGGNRPLDEKTKKRDVER